MKIKLLPGKENAELNARLLNGSNFAELEPGFFNVLGTITVSKIWGQNTTLEFIDTPTKAIQYVHVNENNASFRNVHFKTQQAGTPTGLEGEFNRLIYVDRITNFEMINCKLSNIAGAALHVNGSTNVDVVNNTAFNLSRGAFVFFSECNYPIRHVNVLSNLAYDIGDDGVGCFGGNWINQYGTVRQCDMPFDINVHGNVVFSRLSNDTKFAPPRGMAISGNHVRISRNIIANTTQAGLIIPNKIQDNSVVSYDVEAVNNQYYGIGATRDFRPTQPKGIVWSAPNNKMIYFDNVTATNTLYMADLSKFKHIGASW